MGHQTLSNHFSLQGQVLRLTTGEEMMPHIQPLLDSSDYTQITFSGNTIGVEVRLQFVT